MSEQFTLRSWRQRLVQSARIRRTAMLGLDLCGFILSGLLAFLLRFDFDIPQHMRGFLGYALVVWPVVKFLAFWIFRLHRGAWRYVSINEVCRLFLANVVGACIASVLILAIAPPGFPRSIYVIDFFLCVIATAGNRFAFRLFTELSAARKHARGKCTLIYGAGNAGVSLLRETRLNPNLGYSVCGFIDDAPAKRGQGIQGSRVLGAGTDLGNIAARHRVQQVLIAIPSATGAQMARILSYCHASGVACKTVPGMAEIIEQIGLARQIRDVSVDDLLGRTPVHLNQQEISARLQDTVVVVTGAAGSIGSELCRQIARFGPRSIIGFEIAETALFHLERELRQSFPDLLFYPEIGSVQDPGRLDEVFRKYSPAVVYHAAAYKHVPMMEVHVFEAVKNNVFGTHNVALAAANHGVESFVMISTDKAVHPTSIMGVTKRIAELLILSLQNGGPKYVSVRFGNVLGSNGSVIPIFKQQIASGGPVTVTHRDMRRYFMTTPEASQLVLQASTMGKGGEIFVLDMGVPVKIVDLARNLILLSGLRPGEDIKIEFTGARPGEKLYEELNSIEEDMLPTPHEKIRIFAASGLPPDGMTRRLGILQDVCATRDLGRLVLEFKDMVPDYNASAHILRRLLHDERSRAATTALGGVSLIAS